MKVFIVTTLFVIFLSFDSLSVQASNYPTVLNAEKYAEGAVRYEIHGTSYVQLTADSIFVTRQITYSGFVFPPSQVSWQEEIKGITYSGTLLLKSHTFNPKTQKTIATYEGTLTSE